MPATEEGHQLSTAIIEPSSHENGFGQWKYIQLYDLEIPQAVEVVFGPQGKGRSVM
jgi:hypothetical protein